MREFSIFDFDLMNISRSGAMPDKKPIIASNSPCSAASRTLANISTSVTIAEFIFYN